MGFDLEDKNPVGNEMSVNYVLSEGLNCVIIEISAARALDFDEIKQATRWALDKIRQDYRRPPLEEQN